MRKITVTTMLLSKLQTKNQKIVTGRSASLDTPLCRRPERSRRTCFSTPRVKLISSHLRQLRLFGLMHIQVLERAAVAAERPRSKQGIVRRYDQFGMRLEER